nr:hypothetical protein Iba_chr06cCG10330 [Ipomoea batatas]
MKFQLVLQDTLLLSKCLFNMVALAEKVIASSQLLTLQPRMQSSLLLSTLSNCLLLRIAVWFGK